MNYKNIILSISLFYILFITIMLSINLFENSKIFKTPHIDKLIHVAIYLVMNLLSLYLFNFFLHKKKSIATLAPTVFTIFYSILVEFIQPYFGRSFELLDIAANCIGAIVAIPIFSWIDRLTTKY